MEAMIYGSGVYCNMHLGATGIIELPISRQSDLNKDFLCSFD